MRLDTNQNASVARRNLGLTADTFARSMERLSSGLRINRAADDAAGLSISQKLQSKLRGLKIAQRNAEDGINLVQTADGALNEVHSMLQRMRELVVQASNETLGQDELAATNNELQQLRAQVDQIQQTTKFNGRQLLVGSSSTVPVTTTTVSLAGTSVLSTGSTVSGITPPMMTVTAPTSPMQTGSTVTGPAFTSMAPTSELQSGTGINGSYNTSTTSTVLDPTSQLGAGSSISGTHSTSTTNTTLDPASQLQPGGTVTSPPSAPTVAAGSAYNTGDTLTGSQTVTTSTTTAVLDATSPLKPGDTVSGAPNPDILASGSQSGPLQLPGPLHDGPLHRAQRFRSIQGCDRQ